MERKQLRVLKISGLPSKQRLYNAQFVYELVRNYPGEIQVSFVILEPVFVLSRKGMVLQEERKEYLSPSPHCKIFPQRSYLLPIARSIYFRAYGEFLTQMYTVIRKRIRFDLIHADFVYPEGYWACLLGKIFKKPVVITAHGSDLMINIEKCQLIRKRSAYALANADAIICVSNVLKGKAITLGADEAKLFVVPNGADTSYFKPMQQGEARKKLGLPTQGKIILYIGNLYPIKGPNFLIEAMSRILSQEKSLKDLLLIIVGEGEMETSLKQQVEQLKISQNVLFVGRVAHKEVPYWMNASDILCIPSRSEGLPCVSVEALACGKPVVASHVGGLPEVITNENLGFLVPPGDCEQLASALLKAFSREWDADRIAKHAFERYSWHNIAQATVDVYKFAVQNSVGTS